MKANELRIGNFIRYGIGFYRVKSIHTESVLKEEVHVYIELNQKLSNYCVSINEIQPITLTEELFSKLPGNEWLFVGNGRRKILQHKKFKAIEIEYSNNQVYVYFNNELINIKDYLHELQNIYFALTGEELNIEL